MFDGILDAFGTLLQWPNPLLIVAAAAFGFTMGIVPGLGGAIVMVLLLPLTVDMSPASAVIVLMAGYGVVGTGGMVTSVVLNTPGTPENAATTLDGYPLARAGRAPEALGAGAAASTWGALAGLAVLLVIIPFARPLVLALSYPDFLMLAVLGLSLIAVITRGQAYRALISAALGLMLAFVGLDPLVGRPRFTFGQIELWDGIPLVPALIGLFAGAELLALYGAGKSIADSGDRDDNEHYDDIALAEGKRSTYWGGFWRVTKDPVGWGRGGLIGTVIGVVPAVGGVVASFLAYAQAAKVSKRPELFGHGSFEGITAAESANDAKEAGALVPTLAFGIPGSIGTAIVLAALLFHGVPAGPSLMRDNIDIIYVLLAAMIVSKLICPLFVWGVGSRVLWFSKLRIDLLVPIITILLFAGTYAASESMLHVALVLVFGYIGYGLQAYGFSRIAFVIAFVLGPLVESSYHQTSTTFGSIVSGVQRPVAGTLLALTVLTLGAPVLSMVRARFSARGARSETADVTDAAVEAEPADADGPDGVLAAGERSVVGPGGLLFEIVLTVLAGVLVFQTVTDLRGDAALVPLVVAVPMLLGLIAVVMIDGWTLLRRRRSHVARATATTAARRPTVTSSPSADIMPARVGSQTESAGGEVATEQKQEAEVAPAGRALVRELRVAAWAIAVFVVSLFLGILPAAAVGLLFFLLVFNRDRAGVAFALVGGVIAAIYSLFTLLLGVSMM